VTSAFESAIGDLTAEINKQRDDLIRVHNSLDGVIGTARSKRRQVSAKVDGRGEIVELKLHGESYRTMAANELAKLIVETIQQAKRSAQEQMWGSLADTLPEGVAVAEVVNGTYDWSEVLGEAASLPQPLLDLLKEPGQSMFEGIDISTLLNGFTGMTDAPTDGDNAGPPRPGSQS
jgi:hypothetical protein